MHIKRPDDIAEARRARNVRQSDLAEVMGVGQQYISKIECGKKQHVSQEFARRLTKYLRLNYRAVFDEAPRQQRVRVPNGERAQEPRRPQPQPVDRRTSPQKVRT